MRVIPILVLSIALALAGCAKKDDGGSTTTTPPTGTTGATTTTTTTPTGTTTPTNNTNVTTPTKPAPMEAAKGTADFSAQVPPGPPPAKTVTIPAGYTMGNLTVTWACAGGAPGCVTSAVSVKAFGLTCDLPAGPVGVPEAAAPCVKEGSITPGEGKIEFTGEGAVVATYTLMVS